jgi:hypothetical protein
VHAVLGRLVGNVPQGCIRGDGSIVAATDGLITATVRNKIHCGRG